MNSKILRLDAPYNIIYAGGRIGRHIATLTIWTDDDGGIYDAEQFAMIDEGGEQAAGVLVREAELYDCRVVCNESNPLVSLRHLAELVKFDLDQEEPVEFGYLWERLSLLGVKVAWYKARDENGVLLKDADGNYIDENVYTINLEINGGGDLCVVHSQPSSGFYFWARGTMEEVYRELHYQHQQYESTFYDNDLLIKFRTYAACDNHLVDLLNKRADRYTPDPQDPIYNKRYAREKK